MASSHLLWHLLLFRMRTSAVALLLLLLRSDLLDTREPAGLRQHDALSRRLKRAAILDDDEVTEKDRIACHELREEYSRVCGRGVAKGEAAFCTAYDNVCKRLDSEEYGIAEEKMRVLPQRIEETAALPARGRLEPIEKEDDEDETGPVLAPPPPLPSSSSASSSSSSSASSSSSRPHHEHRRVDFTDFCNQFKNRYLFVCPNPFRFGQKAVVFCPIYSERCHVPLPEKPVVPTQKPSGGGGMRASIARLCANYRRFASMYCSNPLFLGQSQYRTACDRYHRYCSDMGR